MVEGSLDYKHLFCSFVCLVKGRDEKSIFIMFFTFQNAFVYIWLYSHTASWGQDERNEKVCLYLSVKETVTQQGARGVWEPRLPNCYLELLKKGAKFLQTNSHLLTPPAKCFMLPKGGWVWGTVHVSSSETMLVCSSRSGDISQSFLTLALWTRMCARPLSSWWQMPHFCWREYQWLSSCGIAWAPWEPGSPGSCSAHSPWSEPGIPEKELTLTGKSPLLSLKVFYNAACWSHIALACLSPLSLPLITGLPHPQWIRSWCKLSITPSCFLCARDERMT